MIPIISVHDLVQSPLYIEGKFWVAAGGLLWALSQASNRVMCWFKDVKDVTRFSSSPAAVLMSA